MSKSIFDKIQELEKKIKKFFKNKDVTNIRFSDLQNWQNIMLENYKPKTVKGYKSIINMILETAYLDEIISRNPMSALKAPKEIRELPHFYSVSDIKKIIEHSTGQFRNLVKFAFFSGMLPSEIIALEWNDIDFKELQKE